MANIIRSNLKNIVAKIPKNNYHHVINTIKTTVSALKASLPKNNLVNYKNKNTLGLEKTGKTLSLLGGLSALNSAGAKSTNTFSSWWENLFSRTSNNYKYNINTSNMSSHAKATLNNIVDSWPSNLSSGRLRSVQTALSLVDKGITYSQVNRNATDASGRPRQMDCSSFVSYCLRAGGPILILMLILVHMSVVVNLQQLIIG